MGACDSSQENHEKFISSQIISSNLKKNNFLEENLSSTCLPSFLNKNILSKKENDGLLSLRKNLSTDSSENKKYSPASKAINITC